MSLRRLPVDLDELADAMDDIPERETSFFLDKQTGDVLAVGQEVLSAAEEEDDPDEQMPDWQREEFDQAQKILDDTAGRYEPIPERDRHESWQLMEDFVFTVPDPRLADRLKKAIAGKGAFRRFKDELRERPDVEAHWFDFQGERQREEAEHWLATLEIESTWEPPIRKQRPSDWRPQIVGIHHIRLTIPTNSERAAREFYCTVLGMKEMPAPAGFQKSRGFWLDVGELPIHVAAEDDASAAPAQSHLALLVTDLSKWCDRIMKAGLRVDEPSLAPGCARVAFRDPFGHRIELIQLLSP